MPICLGCTLSRSSRSVYFLALSKCNQVFPVKTVLVSSRVTSRRLAASAAATLKPQEQASEHQALTLVHQISSLIPQVLSLTSHTENSLDIWNELLEYAYSTLSERASNSKARIAGKYVRI
jgi:hypothetical protein